MVLEQNLETKLVSFKVLYNLNQPALTICNNRLVDVFFDIWLSFAQRAHLATHGILVLAREQSCIYTEHYLDSKHEI